MTTIFNDICVREYSISIGDWTVAIKIKHQFMNSVARMQIANQIHPLTTEEVK